MGDCEVGSTRKACKNCTCGRAEAEEKVEKLGLTSDLLENPQSACGNVSKIYIVIIFIECIFCLWIGSIYFEMAPIVDYPCVFMGSEIIRFFH